MLTHCQVQAIAGSIATLYSASSVVLVEGVAALRPLLLHPLLAENLKINVRFALLLRMIFSPDFLSIIFSLKKTLADS